ncbi:hypothetical protein [Pseudonocardia sp. KRD291]|uniref:hypothetical protein n=1 Tax=Pseudonocardia sp. KRD291 TaxID=2792007 RepID=UPI001C49FED7|nr:hypothetical protein [Pseudonocardia sp. KRD291]MBW0103667.1 hypothetical protein [Pseudonocardia sp. KRD291]
MTPFTMTAVHSQGAIGRTGSLRITDRGLRFTPMQTNLPGQREPLELAFADVTFVGTAPRRFWPPAFNGQYLRRLQLGSRETGTHLFVVRNVDETARVVRDLWLHEKTD